MNLVIALLCSGAVFVVAIWILFVIIQFYKLFLGLRSTNTQLTLARKQEEEEDELN